MPLKVASVAGPVSPEYPSEPSPAMMLSVPVESRRWTRPPDNSTTYMLFFESNATPNGESSLPASMGVLFLSDSPMTTDALKVCFVSVPVLCTGASAMQMQATSGIARAARSRQHKESGLGNTFIALSVPERNRLAVWLASSCQVSESEGVG